MASSLGGDDGNQEDEGENDEQRRKRTQVEHDVEIIKDEEMVPYGKQPMEPCFNMAQ